MSPQPRSGAKIHKLLKQIIPSREEHCLLGKNTMRIFTWPNQERKKELLRFTVGMALMIERNPDRVSCHMDYVTF